MRPTLATCSDSSGIQHRLRSGFSKLALGLLVLGLVACGRKATHDDCQVVVDRNVEVQLAAQGVTDPAVVTKRRDEMRASMKEDIDKCVGKRVTDDMIACVKNASTAEQIDKCLR